MVNKIAVEIIKSIINNLKNALTMKKLVLAVIAISVIGMTSCKKEEAAQPEINNTVKVGKKDTGSWD